TICGLSYRLEGAENIPDEACVVLMKHSSVYETLVQLVLFPMQCWVLKRELMWLPFFGWAVATLKPIAINRGKGGAAVKQVVSQGIKRLAAGITIVIFPEGTRMAVGETRRYGISGALLAKEARAQILPIAHNAGYHWPRQRNSIDPGVVTFVIGSPIDPGDREPREINEEIQIWIEAEVARLDSE
ncbi:MAG: 1-acyl-sn-glycerol-3-phosphate acyltransferase, partial [Hyphomicrobiales bacterium]|nr:1-acyl-sn-glycerol-3-phosphate acyltransferase [Hyphomicrobiales bacterium]